MGRVRRSLEEWRAPARALCCTGLDEQSTSRRYVLYVAALVLKGVCVRVLHVLHFTHSHTLVFENTFSRLSAFHANP